MRWPARGRGGPSDLVLCDLGLRGAPGTALAERLRRPVLVCYTGSAAPPPLFDLVLHKPAVPELLHLLGAPRLRVTLALGDGGAWQGRILEEGLSCHGRSPGHALRILAQALDAGGADGPARGSA